MDIQDIKLEEIDGLLNLNNAHAQETSLLDESGMYALLRMAFYSRGIKNGSLAVLIALDQSAPYDNPNFNWFKQRYNTFIYIDRVIVSESSRGLGLATKLYRDLATKAVDAGHDRIVCEVNRVPPNPGSDAFHLAMGFVTVGEAAIFGETKRVRYLEANPTRILRPSARDTAGANSLQLGKQS